MTPYETIRRKRDGGRLSDSEIAEFFEAYSAGNVTEYQMAALLMAVFFVGLDDGELSALVAVMIRSGDVADLSSVPGVKVDKHSTGGVGDKVSLVLAPLVACLGVPVPMMSGRGLGHTGGTVDKLETIPGFRLEMSLDEYRAQMEQLGCALIAASPRIAPLDRRLYALRDVSGTVESIPLIASSIMSKKIAAGVDALVLDVKLGNGAFIADASQAEELARTMIKIGAAHGVEVTALLTAMDRPLGHAIGNALEVEEAIAALRGGGPDDLRAVTVALAAEMLVLGRAAPDAAAGSALAAAALDDGRALDMMRRIITTQGGNAAVLDDPAILPQAPVQRVLACAHDGHVQSMDARAIGVAAVMLGAGRTSLESVIDPAVGFHVTIKTGDVVVRGQPIATVHARDDVSAERALAALARAITIGSEPMTASPLIARRIT